VLICKGFAVSFIMKSGRKVSAPAGYGFLHDPSGSSWARGSGLVAPFQKRGDEISNSAARSYFGNDPKGGAIALPPKSLGAWKRVGEVAEILYTRRRPAKLPTAHADDYYHPISESARVTLYRRGRLLRVELGSGCVWNERGIVKP
jgi:hypothetical protein